jgi:hypothetical protein
MTPEIRSHFDGADSTTYFEPPFKKLLFNEYYASKLGFYS